MRIKIPKNWRELPKIEKMEIPKKVFQIEESELKRIRQIKDPRKRLVEAATLQYETFNDIHSYLTAWIAGYSSDSIVRQKLGSSLSLFEAVKGYPQRESQNSSWADIKRKIKIPSVMSGDLAEETGIHLGDGNLHISRDRNGWFSYRYMITGNLTEEIAYHEGYIQPLLRRLYGFQGVLARREENNELIPSLVPSLLSYLNRVS